MYITRDGRLASNGGCVLPTKLAQKLLDVVADLHERLARFGARDERRVALVAWLEAASAQRLLRAGDGEALLVEQRADAPQVLDVAGSAVPCGFPSPFTSGFFGGSSSLSIDLRIWLALNVSTRRSVIVSGWPVCGLRPRRWRLSRRTKLPKPEILIFSPRPSVS